MATRAKRMTSGDKLGALSAPTCIGLANKVGRRWGCVALRSGRPGSGCARACAPRPRPQPCPASASLWRHVSGGRTCATTLCRRADQLVVTFEDISAKHMTTNESAAVCRQMERLWCDSIAVCATRAHLQIAWACRTGRKSHELDLVWPTQ